MLIDYTMQENWQMWILRPKHYLYRINYNKNNHIIDRFRGRDFSARNRALVFGSAVLPLDGYVVGVPKGCADLFGSAQQEPVPKILPLCILFPYLVIFTEKQIQRFRYQDFGICRHWRC